jgi:cytochrome c-type biogenesis protein CcmH
MLALALVVVVAAVGFRAVPAFAFYADHRLANPREEARAERIMQDLRCPVCQDESIAQSDADLAADLRQLIRKMVAAGDSDAQIRHYIVARYGQWILLKPRFELSTYALWLAPAGFLGLALVGIGFYFRGLRRSANEIAPKPLTTDEKRRLARWQVQNSKDI